jgi:hypothetical protein
MFNRWMFLQWLQTSNVLIFADGLQDKPNSVPVLRALNDRLSSFAHLIPQVDLDGVVVLSLHDALARVRILKDRQRSRADFGTTRSISSSDPFGLPSGRVPLPVNSLTQLLQSSLSWKIFRPTQMTLINKNALSKRSCGLKVHS